MLFRLIFIGFLVYLKVTESKRVRETDVYSSVHDLSNIFELEQRLVRFVFKL